MQGPDHIGMGADQQLGIVALAQLGCHGPRKLFGGQRELRVDAGLVAARVLPVPAALQRVNSRKPWPSRVVHENAETFRFPP